MIFHFAHAVKVTDNAPFVNSKWRNLIYAKFICWPCIYTGLLLLLALAFVLFYEATMVFMTRRMRWQPLFILVPCATACRGDGGIF